MSALNESSVVVAADHTTSAEVEGESVILDLEDGIYYGLNSSGSRIWNEIQQPKTLEQVANIIIEEYDIEYDECLRDIKSLTRDLENSGLVEIEK